MKAHEKINYLEFPTSDIDATKTLYSTVFGWSFTDVDPDYSSFSEASVDGGFYRAERAANTENGSALVVFYSDTIEATQKKIEAAGGSIVKPVFTFLGGRRFHFLEPNDNEFAVWTDIET